MKNLTLLLCTALSFLACVQTPKAQSVNAAIEMAETVIAETALEKDQQPTRYNYWMYQNYMIAEGIKNMGGLGAPRIQ